MFEDAKDTPVVHIETRTLTGARRAPSMLDLEPDEIAEGDALQKVDTSF